MVCVCKVSMLSVIMLNVVVAAQLLPIQRKLVLFYLSDLAFSIQDC